MSKEKKRKALLIFELFTVFLYSERLARREDQLEEQLELERQRKRQAKARSK
jgi:hypothetical protein